MDLQKLHIDEVRGLDIERLGQVSNEIREKIFETRIDIYQPAGSLSGKMRGYKRSLARVLMVRGEKLKAKNSTSGSK